MDPRIEEAQELVTSLKTKCQLRKEKLSRSMQLQDHNRASNNNNNNNEAFENNYHHHRSSSGRSSTNSAGRSHESAFSSPSGTSSEGEESETGTEDRSLCSASTSGRSSAEQSVNSGADLVGNSEQRDKQFNPNSNLVLNEKWVWDLVERVRREFLDGLRPDSSDKYEQVDLVELRRGLLDAGHHNQDRALSFRLISRFMNFKSISELTGEKRSAELDKAVGEAIEKLREFLQFRRHYQLSLVMDDHFCKEIHMLHGIFQFGCDKNGLPILYLRARVHRRWSRDLDECFRRYVAWQVNLLTKSYSGAHVETSIGRNAIERDGSFGICFDCLNVSYSCVDMDFLSFLVKVLINYYPNYCRYALCVDLPWLFRSVWKVVRGWLPEDARNTVHLITSKQLTEFIDEDQIPNSMQINDLPIEKKPAELKHRLPKSSQVSLKSIDELAKNLNLSSSEVKQFKAHVEKVRKEYEKMGAI